MPGRTPPPPSRKESEMETYILLTRLSPEAVAEPKFIEKLERKAADRIHKHCPEVKWVGSYSVLGPYDYVDIFEAPGSEAATKVALLIRSFGHGTTETWIATPWDRSLTAADAPVFRGQVTGLRTGASNV